MSNSKEYYKKYYRYFYNYQAIKNHMIEKKIYSPSDFRYYCHQMINELNEKSLKSNNTITEAYTSSNEDLNKLEKSYILSSINFLFNIDDQKTNSNLFPSFSKTLLNFSSNLQSIFGNISKNIIPNTSTSSIDTSRLEKLMNLIGANDIDDFEKEFKKEFKENIPDEYSSDESKEGNLLQT